jgi:NAD(P)-dependent dehydrogenase (short-subunit alcohol dehydrogenase family)
MHRTSARPVAIVTGAARGIGRACALALGASGFNVVLADLAGSADPPLRDAEREVRGLGVEAAGVVADVARLDQHGPLIAAATERWGRIDCLVNNAGVGVLHRGDVLDVTPESFDRCIDVNTRAVFFLTQAVARHMLAQGEIGEQHRSIVNITSSNAAAVSITRGEYCVSKCASSMTTRVFGVRLAEAGIGVYEVRPGIIETAMTLPVKARYDREIANGLVPAKRWGYPADVASTVRAMAQGALIYTVGQAVTVDGGLTVPRF